MQPVIDPVTVRDIVSARAHRLRLPARSNIFKCTALQFHFHGKQCSPPPAPLLFIFHGLFANRERRERRGRATRTFPSGRSLRPYYASAVWKRSVCVRAANTSTPLNDLQQKVPDAPGTPRVRHLARATRCRVCPASRLHILHHRPSLRKACARGFSSAFVARCFVTMQTPRETYTKNLVNDIALRLGGARGETRKEIPSLVFFSSRRHIPIALRRVSKEQNHTDVNIKNFHRCN